MSTFAHSRRVVSLLAIAATAAGTALTIVPAAQASPTSRSDDTAAVNGVVYTTLQSGGRIYIGGEFDFAGRWSGAGQVVDVDDGRVATPGLRIQGQVNTVIPDGIGGWFIGGGFTQVLGAKRLGLARITKAGKLSSFRADVSGTVTALAYSGGNLFVGGSFSSVGGTTRSNLASVVGGSGAVTSWNPGANGTVNALQPKSGSASVYVGGSFSQAGGESRSGLAEISLASGAPTTWNPGVTGEVRALEASGGTVYLGGNFTAAGGASRTDLAALDPDTGSATSWAPSTDGAVNALAITGNSTVVAGGAFTSVNGQSRKNLVGFSNDGSVSAWQRDANGEVFDLESTPNGDVQLVGDFTSVDGVQRLRGASLNPSGDLGAWDPSTDAAIRAASVSTAKDAAGTIVSKTLLGGNFEYVNGAPRQNIAAIDVASGDLDRSFVADTDAIVKALAIAPAGDKLFLGGGFTLVNGVYRSRLAALNPTTGAALSWSANAAGSVNALAVNADSLYVGGGFSSISRDKALSNLARVSITTSDPDPGFDPNPGGTIRALEATSDGSKIFAVGPFTSFAGQSRPGAALVDASGSLDAWAPSEGGSSIAADLSPDESRIYFSTSKNRMFAYDYAGTAPNTPTWITRTGGDIQAIAATPSEIYVGGHFRNFPEEKKSRNHLASVYVSNGLATDWNPGANGSFGVWSITATSDSLLIGGDFNRAGSRRQPGFARFAGTP
ncbi:MAG: hypothetical protein ABI720_01420 [Actinomycetes bacterium]